MFVKLFEGAPPPGPPQQILTFGGPARENMSIIIPKNSAITPPIQQTKKSMPIAFKISFLTLLFEANIIFIAYFLSHKFL